MFCFFVSHMQPYLVTAISVFAISPVSSSKKEEILRQTEDSVVLSFPILLCTLELVF